MTDTNRRRKQTTECSHAASSRGRKRRRPETPLTSVSVLSDAVFRNTWDNPEDAVYDRWRKIFGTRVERRLARTHRRARPPSESGRRATLSRQRKVSGVARQRQTSGRGRHE